MNVFRKTLVGAAVGMALASGAQAGSLLFDTNGAAGANANGVDRFIVDVFDWLPGNMLIKNTVPLASADDPTAFYAQARLSSLSRLGAPVFSYPVGSGQLTFQMRMWVTPSASGAAITYDNAAPPVGSSNVFDVFYNPSSIANDVTGCGFGTMDAAFCGAFPGTPILSGTITLQQPLTLVDNGAIVPGPGVSNGLDQSPDLVDHDHGVTTHRLSMGTSNFNIDVTSFDAAFFLSNISSLSVDMRHSDGGVSPFQNVNPSDSVVGNLLHVDAAGASGTAAALANRTATYGTDLVNNFVCGVTGGGSTAPCDIHLESDARSTVLTEYTPEPGSLALLGLGLAALGAGVRRRRVAR